MPGDRFGAKGDLTARQAQYALGLTMPWTPRTTTGGLARREEGPHRRAQQPPHAICSTAGLCPLGHAWYGKKNLSKNKTGSRPYYFQSIANCVRPTACGQQSLARHCTRDKYQGSMNATEQCARTHMPLVNKLQTRYLAIHCCVSRCGLDSYAAIAQVIAMHVRTTHAQKGAFDGYIRGGR